MVVLDFSRNETEIVSNRTHYQRSQTMCIFSVEAPLPVVLVEPTLLLVPPLDAIFRTVRC
jgi:hypothetical protein